MKKLLLISTLLIVLAGGLVWFFVFRPDDTEPASGSTTSIKSYEECVNAGHPVAESNPQQCRTPDGVVFYGPVIAVVTDYVSLKGVKIKVTEPVSGVVVSSPLIVRGEVPGNWSFEASFPLSLSDESGNILDQVPAQLNSDWMTGANVPFEATLEFASPTPGSVGKLILHRDNPSGLPENEDSLTIPIKF